MSRFAGLTPIVDDAVYRPGTSYGGYSDTVLRPSTGRAEVQMAGATPDAFASLNAGNAPARRGYVGRAQAAGPIMAQPAAAPTTPAPAGNTGEIVRNAEAAYHRADVATSAPPPTSELPNGSASVTLPDGRTVTRTFSRVATMGPPLQAVSTTDSSGQLSGLNLRSGVRSPDEIANVAADRKTYAANETRQGDDLMQRATGQPNTSITRQVQAMAPLMLGAQVEGQNIANQNARTIGAAQAQAIGTAGALSKSEFDRLTRENASLRAAAQRQQAMTDRTQQVEQGRQDKATAAQSMATEKQAAARQKFISDTTMEILKNNPALTKDENGKPVIAPNAHIIAQKQAMELWESMQPKNPLAGGAAQPVPEGQQSDREQTQGNGAEDKVYQGFIYRLGPDGNYHKVGPAGQ